MNNQRTDPIRASFLLFLLAAWVTIFVVAISTDSWGFRRDLRELLQGSRIGSFHDVAVTITLIVFTWTWTSTLVLCSLASLIGEIGRAASSLSEEKPSYGAALNTRSQMSITARVRCLSLPLLGEGQGGGVRTTGHVQRSRMSEAHLRSPI